MEHQKETLESDIRKYMDLRLEDLKLKAVDGLSVGVRSKAATTPVAAPARNVKIVFPVSITSNV